MCEDETHDLTPKEGHQSQYSQLFCPNSNMSNIHVVRLGPSHMHLAVNNKPPIGTQNQG